MDDLISRQAAIDTIHKAVRDNFPQGEDDKPMTKTQLMMFSINKSISTAVKALPSAVVRCRDCKHWKNGEYPACHNPKWFECAQDSPVVPADMFCGWGERKTE